MDDVTKRKSIVYWEKRRIVYNALLVPASMLGWHLFVEASLYFDQTPASLTDPAVIGALVAHFIGANIRYSFVYVIEFFFPADEPRKFWPAPGRTVFLVIGCLLGMWLAIVTVDELQYRYAGPMPPSCCP